MTHFQMLETMAKVGAIITNSHIVYTSGRHGDSYVNKDAIYPHTSLVSQLCETLAQHYSTAKIDAVAAPAIGGVILSQWTAYHLSKMNNREIFSVYAEKETGTDNFVMKRGYDKLIAKKRVLILEDVLTTGGSVKKVIDICRAIPAEVAGVAALCNRGGLAKEFFDVEDFFSLVRVDLGSWEPSECPLCAKHIPINTDVGKGREFQERNSKIPSSRV